MKLNTEQRLLLKQITKNKYEVGMYAWQKYYSTLSNDIYDINDLSYPCNWYYDELIQLDTHSICYALYAPNGSIIAENLDEKGLFEQIEKELKSNLSNKE